MIVVRMVEIASVHSLCGDVFLKVGIGVIIFLLIAMFIAASLPKYRIAYNPIVADAIKPICKRIVGVCFVLIFCCEFLLLGAVLWCAIFGGAG